MITTPVDFQGRTDAEILETMIAYVATYDITLTVGMYLHTSGPLCYACAAGVAYMLTLPPDVEPSGDTFAAFCQEHDRTDPERGWYAALGHKLDRSADWLEGLEAGFMDELDDLSVYNAEQLAQYEAGRKVGHGLRQVYRKHLWGDSYGK